MARRAKRGQFFGTLTQQHLVEIRDGVAEPAERLVRVLETFAHHVQESRGHRESELAACSTVATT
jgi:hypothetical protein